MLDVLTPKILNYRQLSKDTLWHIFVDFLQGGRSTRIYNFLYQDEMNEVEDHSGLSGWDKALTPDSRYYIYPNEIDLLARSMEALANLPYCPNFVELGIGSAKAVMSKTIPIIQALKPQRCVVNDLSSGAALGAKAIIEHRFPGLSVQSVVADFLDVQSELYETHDANVVMTGSTISNITFYNGQMPVDELVAYLKTIGQLIGHEGTLVITQDSNQDPDSMQAAYAGLDIAAFHLDMLYRVTKFLGIEGFDLSTLRYEPIWEPHCHLLANTFVNTREQNIVIGHKKMTLPVGQRLYVSNCYKYPAVDFIYMARMAGLYPVWSRPDRDGRVVMHALRKI